MSKSGFKQKIYIESTVWYQMVNYEESDFKKIVNQLFLLIDHERYEPYISNTVLEEISHDSPKYRKKVEKLIQNYNPTVLIQNAEVEEIASAYIENAFRGKAREEVISDAYQAAVATVGNISYIASYNYRNLLSVKVQEHINSVNLLAGYNHFLSIMPPFMFLDLNDYNGEKGAISNKVWDVKLKYGKSLIEQEKMDATKRQKNFEKFVAKRTKKLKLRTYHIGRELLQNTDNYFEEEII